MTFFRVSPHTALPSYGTKACRFCSLTVAEYLNGQLYPLSSGDVAYIHDACYRLSESNSIRPPPHGCLSHDPVRKISIKR